MQVKDYPLLLLEYEVCENCEQREHELLAAYKKENGTYPLANWRGRRSKGIKNLPCVRGDVRSVGGVDGPLA